MAGGAAVRREGRSGGLARCDTNGVPMVERAKKKKDVYDNAHHSTLDSTLGQHTAAFGSGAYVVCQCHLPTLILPEPAVQGELHVFSLYSPDGRVF